MKINNLLFSFIAILVALVTIISFGEVDSTTLLTSKSFSRSRRSPGLRVGVPGASGIKMKEDKKDASVKSSTGKSPGNSPKKDAPAKPKGS